MDDGLRERYCVCAEEEEEEQEVANKRGKNVEKGKGGAAAKTINVTHNN